MRNTYAIESNFDWASQHRHGTYHSLENASLTAISLHNIEVKQRIDVKYLGPKAALEDALKEL